MVMTLFLVSLGWFVWALYAALTIPYVMQTIEEPARVYTKMVPVSDPTPFVLVSIITGVISMILGVGWFMDN